MERWKTGTVNLPDSFNLHNQHLHSRSHLETLAVFQASYFCTDGLFLQMSLMYRCKMGFISLFELKSFFTHHPSTTTNPPLLPPPQKKPLIIETTEKKLIFSSDSLVSLLQHLMSLIEQRSWGARSFLG